MQSMNIDLALLSAKEKRALADQLALELASEKAEYSDEETALWVAIGDALASVKVRPMSGQGLGALDAFATKFGKAKYRACAAALDALVKRACLPHARKVVRTEMRRVMLQCLAQHMQSRDIPVSATTLLHQFEYLEDAIDQQYPSYLQCGLLHRVISIAA